MKEYRTFKIDIISSEENIYLNLRKDIEGLNGNIEDTIILNYKMNADQAQYLIDRLQKARSALNIIKDEEKGIKTFVLNDYLMLKLEDKRTYIYVDGKRFRQCIRLMLNIPVDQVEQYDEIKSIDEAVDKEKQHSLWLGKVVHDENGLEAINSHIEHTITPEEEFKGHCSNMQAWVENDYNTQILFRNMAFPLLKKLVEVGDPKAKSKYKDELAYRLSSNELSITHYLMKQGYLKDLEEAEIEIIINDLKPGIAKTMLRNRHKQSNYRFDSKIMALKNEDFIISDLKQNPVNYDNYKKPFPLSQLERYSKYVYRGVYVFFGLEWNGQRVVYKNSNLQEAISIFESGTDDIMVQIPREPRRPLRLYIEKENLAIYCFPILIF